jgi:hypothetical protein
MIVVDVVRGAVVEGLDRADVTVFAARPAAFVAVGPGLPTAVAVSTDLAVVMAATRLTVAETAGRADDPYATVAKQRAAPATAMRFELSNFVIAVPTCS